LPLAAAAALALAAAAPAYGADAEGRFAVKGAGGARCAVFVEAREARNEAALAAYQSWMSGYLTAANRLSPETFDMIAWQGVGVLLAAIEGHCRRNPDLPFHAAIGALVTALAPDRVTARSALVRIPAGETTLVIYEETLRRAQKQLADRKLYTGRVDGKFGDGTRRAIEAFQKSDNITVNGLPDQQTLFRLLRSAETAPPAAAPAPAPAPAQRPRR
jgi:hypothetical protein